MGFEEGAVETDRCLAPGWRGNDRTGQNNPFSRVETKIFVPVKSISSRRLWRCCPAVAVLTVLGPASSACGRPFTMLLVKSEKCPKPARSGRARSTVKADEPFFSAHARFSLKNGGGGDKNTYLYG
jgi:hypothetical protein